MIYLTGDTHGYIDIRKLLDNDMTKRITSEDYLIICGDFGLVWNYKKEIRKERKWLDWLNQRPWTTLFADGNHECFPRLYAYEEKEWLGGHVHVIRDRVLHLMRGEIFNLEGNSIFVMGGASSHDRGPAKGDADQVRGKYWWDEEIPSEEERHHGLVNLEQHNYEVDYIVTHCLPTSWQDIVKQGEYKPDAITDYLETISQTVRYRHWYCGHYHYNIDVNDKMTILFSRILPIGRTIADSETIVGTPKYRRNDTVLFRHEGKDQLGIIKDVMPWGTLLRHDEPYYDIQLFTEDSRMIKEVKETKIIEKSLVENKNQEESI